MEYLRPSIRQLDLVWSIVHKARAARTASVRKALLSMCQESQSQCERASAEGRDELITCPSSLVFTQTAHWPKRVTPTQILPPTLNNATCTRYAAMGFHSLSHFRRPQPETKSTTKSASSAASVCGRVFACVSVCLSHGCIQLCVKSLCLYPTLLSLCVSMAVSLCRL